MSTFDIKRKKKESVDKYINTRNHTQRRIVVYFILAILAVGIFGYWFFTEKKRQQQFKADIAAQNVVWNRYLQDKASQSQLAADELFSAGVGLAKKGMLDISLYFLKGATEKDPKWRDAAYYTGTVYLAKYQTSSNKDKDDLESAKKYLLRASELDPIYAPTFETLAQVYSALGDEKNAKICYNKAKDFKK